MTRRELNYIGGLQHIRTEQYLEYALQEANPQGREFRPQTVDLGLYRPLLRGEHTEVTTERQQDGDKHIVYFTQDNDLHAKARIQSGQGPRYRPPRTQPDDAIEETETGRRSNPGDIGELTEEIWNHTVTPTFKQGYSDHAYSSLLLFGKYAKQLQDHDGPPMAMKKFSATYDRQLPRAGSTVKVKTKPGTTYSENDRKHQDVTAKVTENDKTIAEASFTACTAPDIIGNIQRNP